MRIKLSFTIEKDSIPIQYRSIFLSYFKNALGCFNPALLSKYYDSPLQKNFTFAVYLPKARFENDIIIIPNYHINMVWSSDDMEAGVAFYNAFLKQKYKKYPLPYGNFMTLESIRFEKEQVITRETIDVIFLAPLCVRDHNKETNNDQYYAFDREGFEKALRKTLLMQIENNSIPKSTLKNFKMQPVNAKRVIVKHYNQNIESSVGEFRLTGNIELLTHLYTSGMGARKSAGFGCFEIMK